MINRFLNWFGLSLQKVQTDSIPKKERPKSVWSTDDMPKSFTEGALPGLWEKTFKDGVTPELEAKLNSKPVFAMDNQLNVKAPQYANDVIPQGQLFWYASQGFLGYQLCAMIAQQWLVSKCCLMPAEDAVRNGYEITVNDGEKVAPEVLDYMRELDVKYRLNYNLTQFVQFGRIFGIRIAMFKVESNDPDYYLKPFNPDGITPGSYKGISQIDPYWISPQLDQDSSGDPSSIHFYEPTWWVIAGLQVHRTHLIIMRTEEVPDILKPSYVYGGVPIPQKIVERVYAAERTANEAPMLALTKRTDVINVDMDAVGMRPGGFDELIQKWVYTRDNFGIKALGLQEKMSQFDTSLADLDEVIMTQFQLVAAAAGVPATKLLGTQPKGFNSTGEYEEANYHEALESIQAHALTPLLERHHLLLMLSEVLPKFNIKPFNTTITWKPLDAMTAKEQAELNKNKAETGKILMEAGAIDGEDERERVITDPDSGYSGMRAKDINGETEVLSDPQSEEENGF